MCTFLEHLPPHERNLYKISGFFHDTVSYSRVIYGAILLGTSIGSTVRYALIARNCHLYGTMGRAKTMGGVDMKELEIIQHKPARKTERSPWFLH